MSIINSVLNDLENKPAEFVPLKITDVPDNKARYDNKYWIGLVILVLLIAAILIINSKSKAVAVNTDSHFNDVVEVTPVEVVPADVIPAAITSVQIIPVNTSQKPEPPLSQAVPAIEPLAKEQGVTGLQLNESDHFLELTLQLPLGAQSFLKLSSKNRYVFMISNAGKEIIIPEIKDNNWLDSITVDDTAAGLEIQFHTKSDVLVETHHKEEGENYYWVIRLKRSLPVSVIAPLAKQIKEDAPNMGASKPVVIASQSDGEAMESTSVLNSKSHPKAAVKLEIKAVKTQPSDSKRLQSARNMIRRNDWVQAQQQLEKLINSQVGKTARIELLALYKLHNKTTQMKQLLKESLSLYPQQNSFIEFDAGQLFSAKQFLILIKRYKNKFDNINVINMVAASYQNIKQHDNAIKYYQRSLAMNPQQPRKWISLAISQEQKTQFDRALQSYQIALRSGTLNKRLQSFIQKRIRQLSQTAQ